MQIRDAVRLVSYSHCALFDQIPSGERWIAKADGMKLPESFRVIAAADDCPVGYADDQRQLYALQFSIERNDPDGYALLVNFARKICHCTPCWTPENILENALENIRDAAGDSDVLCSMSGGLDSTVCALLTRQALGEKARCVFVDTGLMRMKEAELAGQYFRETLQLNCRRIDASSRVLHALKGLSDLDEKWNVVEGEIQQVLREESERMPSVKVLVVGTNLHDGNSFSAGERLEGIERVVEPLRNLFKEEIRALGVLLGLGEQMINRRPFPGLGLGARIEGEVTWEKLNTLREAEKIFEQELKDAGIEKRLTQYFVRLDERNGETILVLRAVQGGEKAMPSRLPYDLLERTTEQIGEKLGVRRVMYDLTCGNDKDH